MEKGNERDRSGHGQADKPGAGSALLKGAAVLGLAAVISKLIGTLQKIPLQNMAGDAVFGIYNAVYPLYILILFLATAGFPLVVSKFVSEFAAQGRPEEARRVVRVASAALTFTGALCCGLLYFGSDRIAVWMGVAQTGPAIRSVSFALLLVPLMSALRGYFQGFQQMAPTAWSQVVEQAVRVATMFTLLLILMHAGLGPSAIAAGATFGSVTGAAAGLGVMLYFWRHAEREKHAPAPANREAREKKSFRNDWALLKRMAVYAIPLCLGTIATPVLTLVDSFTVPRLLKGTGLAETAALYQFGLYNHGLPLVQLVAMIASSMSAAIVPAIAEARQRGDRAAVQMRAGMSLRSTWLLALPASVGLAMLAEPVNGMLFKTAEGTTAMAVLSFTALFSAVNIVASSVLQGFGAVRAPALYLLLAAGVKAAANAVLVPRLGIDGAAWAAVAAYALAGGLALAHAKRVCGVTAPGGRALMRQIAAICCMALGLLAVTHGAAPLARLAVAMPPRGFATVVALGGVAAGALVYALAVLRLGVVTAAELALVPQLAGKPTALLRKLRLLRS
ncbi:oligosaccharide flippase family protein [Paenibacillus allorhizosphaerae]|uniref:Lipid II flippase MurJ n=1 Tax=Paenibacillus allorhizosphaerae TaxID=2849866 RepID=A0ABM8VS91_9BACL|nr:polysaccharide biosynthesis protein [Paenibacillus allorhizosphaerae]CAG7656341.1 lipid II flippase MurJ [Paenibacillus allorhizosphaerae]